MIRHHRSGDRVLALGLAALLAAVVVPAAVSAATRGTPRATVAAPKTRTLADAVIAPRVPRALSEKAAKAKGGLIDVVVMTSPGVKAPKLVRRPMRVTLRADDSRVLWVGRVRGSDLTRVASAKGVLAVADNSPREAPPSPETRKVGPKTKKARKAQSAAALERATRSGAVRRWSNQVNARGTAAMSASADSASDTPVSAAPAASVGTAGWFDVEWGHRSKQAWDLGYTGEGVRIAIVDDSIDFAHPDLQDSFARVTDSSSPYAGWPMAYDPVSTYLYARDIRFGERNIPTGSGWWTSTPTTVSVDQPDYAGFANTLTGTSLSGVYHIGQLFDENLALDWNGTPGNYTAEWTSVLLVDEHTPGVYDTVYVDLNYNQDFTDDKACTKDDPVSWLDYVDGTGALRADGYADRSGGMIYWISDGAHHPPGFTLAFPELADTPPPAAGSLVLFTGALDHDMGHGTECASVAAGRGRIDGPSLLGEYPSFKNPGTGDAGGIVQGAGKDAGLVAIADVYNNFYLSTLMAYDFAAYGLDGVAATGDEIQIVSNSYGDSMADNDGWDYPSRYLTMLNTRYAPHTTFVFSTGNGGAGYGTSTAPGPTTMMVGASTQMGAGGGWDSIETSAQVTYGDVIPFSNRGPTAMGGLSPAVVADGAFASGSVMLNRADAGNGWRAWEIWGGTSRSAPVAAGNTALAYQAFREKEGRWPTYIEARALMMSGATDLDYDPLVQGAGSIDAARSAATAAGRGGLLVTPDSWSPGTYRDRKPLAFTKLIAPGGSDATHLTVSNRSAAPADVDVTGTWHRRSGVVTMAVTLEIPADGENAYDTRRPDWLADISSLVPANTDLMVVRTAMPMSELDTNGDFSTENRYRVLAYDWTDRNGDGDLTADSDSDGYVDSGEIDPGEYMRFTYGYAVSTGQEMRVARPLARAHDGVYLGLQHTRRDGAPVHVEVEISFWRHEEWDWLDADDSFTLASGASRQVPVSFAVPADASIGTYEGEVRVSDGTNSSVVPVIASVGATGTSFSYGGEDRYAGLLDNGQVSGLFDWGWRAESGDWRFFFSEGGAETPAPGTVRLAHTTWDAAPSDIDTNMFGSTAPLFDDSITYGPADLTYAGGSPIRFAAHGFWYFQTSSGGADDWVSGRQTAGLSSLALHNVLDDGIGHATPFNGRTGTMSHAPLRRDFVSDEDTHSFEVTTTATMDLPAVSGDAYGLTRRYVAEGLSVANGASLNRTVNLNHAGYFEAETYGTESDVDLYIQRWTGRAWSTVAMSASDGGNEYARAVLPSDGFWRARVTGYAVSPGQTFSLRISYPSGYDAAADGLDTGPVAAGSTTTATVRFSKARPTLDDRDGYYEGVASLGPGGSTGAIQVPFTLAYPFRVDTETPAPGDQGVAATAPVTAVFSKHVAPDTLGEGSFYLTSGRGTTTGTVTYDPLTAEARLDAPLSPDTTYTAHLTGDIRAQDGMAWSGHTWTFHTADTLPPDAPLGLAGVAGVGYADLSWTDPSSDFVATRLYRSAASFADVADPPAGDQTQVYEGAAQTFHDEPLDPGTTYLYTAFARDPSGNWSAPATAAVTIPHRSAVTLVAVPPVVAYGAETTLRVRSERLESAATVPDEGARVVVQRRSTSSLPWSNVGTVTCDAAGIGEIRFRPARSYFTRAVRLADSRGTASSSGDVIVAVTFAPRLVADSTRKTLGRPVKLSVSVAPSSMSRYRTVYLQIATPTGWVTKRTAKLDRYGRASFYETRYSRVDETYRVRIGGVTGLGVAYSDRVRVSWR